MSGRRIVLWVAIYYLTVFSILLYYMTGVRADDTPDELHVLSLRTLSINAKDFAVNGRDPLVTSNGLQYRALGQEYDLGVEIDLLKYLYFNSIIHSATDRSVDPNTGAIGHGQFRVVGLEYGIGVDLRRLEANIPVTFGYYHYSQHELDNTLSYGYPVKDAIEFKVYLYQRK